jgi:hypothetical protein
VGEKVVSAADFFSPLGLLAGFDRIGWLFVIRAFAARRLPRDGFGRDLASTYLKIWAEFAA